jgi:hypothetical protein
VSPLIGATIVKRQKDHRSDQIPVVFGRRHLHMIELYHSFLDVAEKGEVLTNM